MMVLPFGVALGKGVTLTVDNPASERVRFRTCLPVGCFVPLTRGAPAVTQLRAGKALNLSVA